MHNPIPALAADPAGFASRLAALPWIPGVSVAGVTPDGIRTASAGVTDTESVAPVDPGTRFRPGSITKLLTATLVMQCVDDGLIALDDAVTSLVPELELADQERAARVTVRHLLSHSSGIDAGDLFIDTGDGDDCLERYVEVLAGTRFLFDPGHTFSYCNAGTVLAGRIVQLVRGLTWEDALRRRVLEPLEMAATTFVTGRDAGEPAAIAGAARGHTVTGSGLEPLPWASDETYTVRGLAPAGGTLVSTAGDLGRLVLGHLGSPHVPSILSAESAVLMRELATRAPGGVIQMLGVGLGWQAWHGSVRAAGANPGQSGVIAVDPESATAVVALTNSDAGVNATHPALDAGSPPAEAEPLMPLKHYTGEYDSHAARVRVVLADGGLRASVAALAPGLPRAAVVGLEAESDVGLTPVDGVTFASTAGPVAFFDRAADGRPRLLRWRMRVSRRVPEDEDQ